MERIIVVRAQEKGERAKVREQEDERGEKLRDRQQMSGERRKVERADERRIMERTRVAKKG